MSRENQILSLIFIIIIMILLLTLFLVSFLEHHYNIKLEKPKLITDDYQVNQCINTCKMKGARYYEMNTKGCVCDFDSMIQYGGGGTQYVEIN